MNITVVRFRTIALREAKSRAPLRRIVSQFSTPVLPSAPLLVRRCRPLRPVGKYGGWGNFANFTKYTAEVPPSCPRRHSVPCLDGHHRRTLARHAVNPRPLDALRSLQRRSPSFPLRTLHGHFLRPQISAGLFSLLRIRRSLAAGAVPKPHILSKFMTAFRRRSRRFAL